jgi:hypothetical protein
MPKFDRLDLAIIGYMMAITALTAAYALGGA